jgi:hypothetical protein
LPGWHGAGARIAQKTKTQLRSFVKRHSSRWELSRCADRHKRKELFEFYNLKKNPVRDLRRVVEHPERLSKRLLEQRIARRASEFSICRRKGERIKSLRGLSIRQAQKRYHLGCVKTLREGRSQNPLRIREKGSGGVAFLYA